MFNEIKFDFILILKIRLKCIKILKFNRLLINHLAFMHQHKSRK